MTANVTEDVQEQVLGAVRKSQEITLDAVKKVVEAVSAAQAKLPAAPFDFKFPELPAVPFADKLPFDVKAPELPQFLALPAPEEAVASAFDFLSKLLAEQRKFAVELIAATSALRPAKAEAESAAE